MMRIGLVVEGVHDYPIIESLVSASLSIPTEEQVFVRLQPAYDATSGKDTDGGCSRVIAWCLANNGDKLRSFFTPVSEDDPAIDFLLIHLDGDALETCSCHAPGIYDGATVSIARRLQLLGLMMNHWLEPLEAFQNKVVHVFPVTETEAWILAAAEPDDSAFDAWETCEAKEELLKRHPRRGRPLGRYYGAHAQNLAARLEAVRARCISYSSFERALIKVAA